MFLLLGLGLRRLEWWFGDLGEKRLVEDPAVMVGFGGGG